MTLVKTPRLCLRPIEEPDWEAVHRYSIDPDVIRHVAWGPNSEEHSREFVRWAAALWRDAPHMNEHFAVVRQDDGRLIGSCNLGLTEGDRQGEIGYAFARDAWGQGYATEAADALLRRGFGELGLHRVHATCAPENIGSIRVLEKIGMRREGLLLEHKWQRDHWRDSCLYAILGREWRARP